MAYQYRVIRTDEVLGDLEKAAGWPSVHHVEVIIDGFKTLLRINGSFISDEDIADAVEKAASAYAATHPVKTSTLKAE
jgi:hypothetical protein